MTDIPADGTKAPAGVGAAPADLEGAPAADKAKDVPAGPPSISYMVVAYIVVIAGAYLSWLLYKHVKPQPPVAVQGVSIFAALYVFAQCIERVMEPFTSWLGWTAAKVNPTDERKRLVTKKAALMLMADTPSVENRALVARIRRNKAVITWAIASFLAMLASGGLGILLLQSVGYKSAPVWVDVLVTGLAIGSGTKPLHDLISNLQDSSSQKEESSAKKAG